MTVMAGRVPAIHVFPAATFKSLMPGSSPGMTSQGGRASSIHRRNRELRAFLDAGGPARRHRLGLGVEADRIRPVLVEIAEAGLLPAAEGVIGDRNGDRHVDADHADIDPG